MFVFKFALIVAKTVPTMSQLTYWQTKKVGIITNPAPPEYV